jgi:hypothetical protein
MLQRKNKFVWQNALHFYRVPNFMFIVTNCTGYEYNQVIMLKGRHMEAAMCIPLYTFV